MKNHNVTLKINNLKRYFLFIGMVISTGLNAQYNQDFDSIQFFGTGYSSATEDLAYNYNWTRSDTNVVAKYRGNNGFMMLPKDNAWVMTEAINFNYGDSVSVGYRVSNITGGLNVTRFFSVLLVDEFDIEIPLFTSASILVSDPDFKCLTLVINYTGSYRVKFFYTASGGNNTHFLEFDNFNTYTPMLLLPVSLTEFKAAKLNADVNLIWSTASEIHAESFEIQVSEDGLFFNSIGYENAIGSEFNGADYSFSHVNAFVNTQTKVLYYRLKMMDTDGSIEYSPLAEAINSNSNPPLKISFNNPFNETLQIRINQNSLVSVIKIKDLQGKTVLVESDGNVLNSELIKINTTLLSKGVYLLTIYSNNEEFITEKIVKQ